jgi:hypothetical protein
MSRMSLNGSAALATTPRRQNEKLRQVHELQRIHKNLERPRQNLEQAIRLKDQLKQTGGQK